MISSFSFPLENSHFFYISPQNEVILDKRIFSYDQNGWSISPFNSSVQNFQKKTTNNNYKDLCRALRKTGEWSANTFDQISHNSEHFVFWCKQILDKQIEEHPFYIQCNRYPDYGLSINSHFLTLSPLTGVLSQQFQWYSSGCICSVEDSKLCITFDHSECVITSPNDFQNQLAQITKNGEIFINNLYLDFSDSENKRIFLNPKGSSFTEKWTLRYITDRIDPKKPQLPNQRKPKFISEQSSSDENSDQLKPRRQEKRLFKNLIKIFKNGSIDDVKRFLDETHINLEAKDSNKIININRIITGPIQATPLIHASYMGRLDIVQLLISMGANVNAKDSDERKKEKTKRH